MSIEDRLNAAATKAEDASEIMHRFSNDPVGTMIPTESGSVPSLAEWLSQNAEALGGLPAVQQFQMDLQNLTDANKGAHLIAYKGLWLDKILNVFPEQFGAVGDGVVDDTVACQAWLNSLPQGSTVSGLPGSKYKLTSGVALNVRGTTIKGMHCIYPKTPASYYHCLRIAANDCNIFDAFVDSPSGLVRDDTGFGILIGAVDNTQVIGCTISRVASAGIWAVGATNFRIANCNVKYPLADGIHVSDACRNGILSTNLVTGSHDDALAVVGDTPSAAAPLNIQVFSNIVDGTFAGHGLVLIACDTVNASHNILRGTAFAGIGSYFWSLTGAPVAKDWANNCILDTNLIVSPGVAPLNANNSTGIFSGAFKNSRATKNRISAPYSEALTPASCIRLLACQGLKIDANWLTDSSSYGIYSPESNVNGASSFFDLEIQHNFFKNIAKEVVLINPTSATIGRIDMSDNQLVDCAYNGATTRASYIAKTGSAQLTISGNKNLGNNKNFLFDAATSTNVFAADNVPESLLAWTPVATPVQNSWTASTSTGIMYQKGREITCRGTTTVTTKGTGLGFKVALPKAPRAGNCPLIAVGRENTNGAPVIGYQSSSTEVAFVTGANGDPVVGNGSVIQYSITYLTDF
ncbi:MAG: right-handed parallel beta-helix repeat-containing protein [Pseudomonas sp.]